MTKPTLPNAWPGLITDEAYLKLEHQFLKALADQQTTGTGALLQTGTEWRRISLGEYLTNPPANLLDPNWKYTPSDQTDVRATWARFGWKPTTR